MSITSTRTGTARFAETTSVLAVGTGLLPVTGLADADGMLSMSLPLIMLGAVVLWLNRRQVTVARLNLHASGSSL